MIGRDAALELALNFLNDSAGQGEPELGADLLGVKEKAGLLVVPYNSVKFLESRDARDQLLDCWPILVNMETGQVRFGRIQERHLWKA